MMDVNPLILPITFEDEDNFSTLEREVSWK